MIAAASLSTRFFKSLPETPCCQSRPFASYEVTRSSCRITGICNESEKFRANRRASDDISLSYPSVLSGKPKTSPTASKSLSISLICRRSFFQPVLWMVSSGRTVNWSSSDTAAPMRLVPGSSAIRRPFVGTEKTSKISVGLVVSFSCTNILVSR
jgi:hypothetical protein